MSSLDSRHLRSVARGQPGTAPADRQQVGSPTRGRGQAGEECGSEHVAAAGAESPEGTWVLSL